MFLMAGKIIPGAEKLLGENLFPEKEQGFFSPICAVRETVLWRKTNILIRVFHLQTFFSTYRLHFLAVLFCY
jgi:hypothetical protein